MSNRRNTVQKNVILNALKDADHPTATELYGLVRLTHPKISRATVFRVLADFAKLGLVRELELLNSDTRYDGNLQPHAHCHCVKCGKVSDVFDEKLNGVMSLSSVEDFRVFNTEIEFNGLCPNCALD